MSVLANWLQTPMAGALARTLLHSLWEGAVVALVLAVVLCVARTSRTRYSAACLSMLALLAGLVVTMGRQMPENPVHVQLTGGRHFHVTNAVEGPLPVAQQNTPPVDRFAWLVPFWVLGVLIFHARALVGWMAARRLRITGVCGAPEQWRNRLNHLKERLGMDRTVALLESCLTEVPVVMGVIRPVILMPVGLLAGLPVGQVDAILLHELAHIRRYDYLVNLMQAVVEGLLFYHPAVWWISRMMRTERENCCDDLVVSVTGGALEYATALTELENRRAELSASPSPSHAALAATDGGLMRRVRRLLGKQDHGYIPAVPVLTATILTVIVATAVMALQFGSDGSTTALKTEMPPAAGSLPVTIPTVPFTKPTAKTVLLVQAQAPNNTPPNAARTLQPDKVLFDRAINNIEHGNYAVARLTLNTLINSYPNSEFLIRAKLAIADSWAREGTAQGLAQAKAEYSDLIQFYPGTPEATEARLRRMSILPYEKWLTEDVLYIISDEERAAFKQLTTDEEREKFVEQFWARRNPVPGSAENQFKQEHYRRIAYANEHFADRSPKGLAGWRTDRGRIYIQYGPPDEIETHPAGVTSQRRAATGGVDTQTYAFEQWRYRLIDGVGQNIILEFVDKAGDGEYRMTMDPNQQEQLLHLPTPAVPGR